MSAKAARWAKRPEGLAISLKLGSNPGASTSAPFAIRFSKRLDFVRQVANKIETPGAASP
jgi:hypothetical protein